MAQETNTQLTIIDDTGEVAPSVYEQYLRYPLMLNSFLIGSPKGKQNPGLPSQLLGPKEPSVAVRVLLVLSIWQSKAARLVGNAIRAFWSSIILSHATRFIPSPPLSPAATHGLVKYYDGKSENAVYFVQTATGNIPLSNKTITPMPMSNVPSRPSLEITISESEAQSKLNALRNGSMDLRSISVREWIELSYIAMFVGEELHLDMDVVEGGNLVHLHSCVQGVVPPGSITDLGAKN